MLHKRWNSKILDPGGRDQSQKTYSFRRWNASCTRARGRARFMRIWQGPWKARPSCQSNTYIPAGFLHLVNGDAMICAPLSAIQKQHISAFRFGDLHAGEVLRDKITGVIHIAGNGLTQFVYPLIAFRSVRADQRMHGQHIHGIVMAQRGLLLTFCPATVLL